NFSGDSEAALQYGESTPRDPVTPRSSKATRGKQTSIPKNKYEHPNSSSLIAAARDAYRWRFPAPTITNVLPSERVQTTFQKQFHIKIGQKFNFHYKHFVILRIDLHLNFKVFFNRNFKSDFLFQFTFRKIMFLYDTLRKFVSILQEIDSVILNLIVLVLCHTNTIDISSLRYSFPHCDRDFAIIEKKNKST
ncbi:Protein of unknown function, partial [Gryllus bimaculatus]